MQSSKPDPLGGRWIAQHHVTTYCTLITCGTSKAHVGWRHRPPKQSSLNNVHHQSNTRNIQESIGAAGAAGATGAAWVIQDNCVDHPGQIHRTSMGVAALLHKELRSVSWIVHENTLRSMTDQNSPVTSI